jgi:hypothetical protein
MAQFTAPKSDQINADDLIGGPMTIVVTAVSANEAAPEQPVNISFEGDGGKPFRPCKSMRRVMVHIWGADASKYVGRAMTLYRDPKVQFGGMQVGGIRISHMSDIPADKLSDGKVQMALTATRAKRAPFTVLPLKDVPKSNASDEMQAWADTFMRNVGRAPDTAKLDAFVAGKADRLAALQQGQADLHAQCQAAISKRREELAPADTADEEDPFTDEPDETSANYDGFITGITTRIAAADTHDAIDEILEDISRADHVPDLEKSKLEAGALRKRRAV